MQTTRCLVHVVAEFAAGVERGEDHFERRFGLVFGVWIDRDATSVVGDGQCAVLGERHFDTVGVSGYGFVHSPTPAQTGHTNLLDGHRHVFALGLGYRFEGLPEGWPSAVNLDAHIQTQWMPEVAFEKDVTDADGDGVPDLYVEPEPGKLTVWPTLTGDAILLTAGFDVRLEF